MTNNNDPFLELWGKTQLKAADYAGTLGFSRGTLNLILAAANEGNLERITQLSHSALEEIENVFIKYQIN
jgi:hypothetical protein